VNYRNHVLYKIFCISYLYNDSRCSLPFISVSLFLDGSQSKSLKNYNI